MSLGNNIKRIRNERNLTQEELGNKIGVKSITIRKYESDEREPNIDTIKKIAEILGISINELFSEETKEIEERFNTSFEYIKSYLNDFSNHNLGEDALQFIKSIDNLITNHLTSNPKVLRYYSKVIDQINNYDKNLSDLYYKLIEETQNTSIDTHKILLISDSIHQQDKYLLSQIDDILTSVKDSIKDEDTFLYKLNNSNKVYKNFTGNKINPENKNKTD